MLDPQGRNVSYAVAYGSQTVTYGRADLTVLARHDVVVLKLRSRRDPDCRQVRLPPERVQKLADKFTDAVAPRDGLDQPEDLVTVEAVDGTAVRVRTRLDAGAELALPSSTSTATHLVIARDTETASALVDNLEQAVKRVRGDESSANGGETA